MKNFIKNKILNGKFKDEYVLLPHITMILTDMLFEFKRLQFPVQLAFAMTINKAQGNSPQVSHIEIGKSMLFTWTGVCDMLTRQKTFWFICVRTRRKNKKYCVSKCTPINITQLNT